MASNSFGQLFKIITWGESHGKAIGVVIDGCPAGLEISEDDINKELKMRAPGWNPFTSPRKEEDQIEILSGIFEGQTTGHPLSLIIYNRDVDSSSYERNVLKPSHAGYAYLEKYGCFDYRGSGRASARETASRVAAGAVAKKILLTQNIHIQAYITQIGSVSATVKGERSQTLFCCDKEAEEKMKVVLKEAINQGDSLGAVIGFEVVGLPVGFGDPVYEKLSANLAKALLSIPACRGFEIGRGFDAAIMRGSEHNDPFGLVDGEIELMKNDAGGVLGGISNGMSLWGRTVFKPTSSIKVPVKSVSLEKKEVTVAEKSSARHDPCVGIRAVAVVEAMVALVLVDAYLMQRCARLW